jgi:RNA polymerase sigma-70 factor (ECF subfamily)
MVEPADPAHAMLASGSPEIDLLKLQGRAEVERAFRQALAKLEDRDRLLLGLHYADGLSLERIGALYRQHRATVARRMAKARRELLDGARELLRERLRLSDSECDSMMALVRSQLRISLGAAESPPP